MRKRSLAESIVDKLVAARKHYGFYEEDGYRRTAIDAWNLAIETATELVRKEIKNHARRKR